MLRTSKPQYRGSCKKALKQASLKCSYSYGLLSSSANYISFSAFSLMVAS